MPRRNRVELLRNVLPHFFASGMVFFAPIVLRAELCPNHPEPALTVIIAQGAQGQLEKVYYRKEIGRGPGNNGV